MQIRVLGCSGAIAKDCRTTSFLVGDSILIDAGTGVGDLTLEEMGRRGQHVGHGMDEVAAAVAVEVDGIFEEVGRQELRLAERARP